VKPLAMIWAMNAARAIGLRGGLPWHFPEDLKHFRSMTTGHAVIMGRRTWDEVGKPLPKRRNIVVTTQYLSLEGAEVATTLEAALGQARATDPCPFIIGGAGLYAAALPLATDLYITLITGDSHEADTYFPVFDETQWLEVERRAGATAELAFLHWRRRDLDTQGAAGKLTLPT
jgi:dihydrofolate reductase